MRNRRPHSLVEQAPSENNARAFFKKPSNHVLFENFLQDFLTRSSLPTDDKQKKAMELRKIYKKNPEVIDEIIKNPEAFYQLISQQTANVANKKDLSTSGFLTSLITSLASLKFSAQFPCLLLLLQAIPVGAEFFYHEGQPFNGLNLCEGLRNCIQAYLSEDEDGFLWNQSMPQVSRHIEGGTRNINSCITLADLEKLSLNIYRGPTQNVPDCTLTRAAANGENITITMTNPGDLIACNIGKDKLYNLVKENCQDSKNLPGLYIALGTGFGAASLLILLGLGIALYRRNEEQRGLSLEVNDVAQYRPV